MRRKGYGRDNAVSKSLLNSVEKEYLKKGIVQRGMSTLANQTYFLIVSANKADGAAI
jgi:hypothetical protein